MRWQAAALFLVVLTACSSDSSSSEPSVPVLPWGSFRHDLGNSGIGLGISANSGSVRLLASDFGTTGSTPAIDNNGNVFVGTDSGVVSFNDRGHLRWRVTTCDTESASMPIGPVWSSPTVTAGGNVVFGSDATATVAGAVFAMRERNNNEVVCLWAFTPTGALPTFSVRSSPQVQLDPRDFAILSVFVGTGAGYLQAINGNIGTARWGFPTGAPAAGPVTSSPALNITNELYVTTPDGLLSAIDGSGRVLWQYPIGVPPPTLLQQSPAVSGTTIFSLGTAGTLFGVNPDGTLKWQYVPQAAIPGSPAFLVQAINVGPDATTDTIVYLADVNGTLYGVRNQDGSILEVQRCSLDPTRTCRTDSCDPGEGTCEDGRCTLSDDQCTADTCINADEGECLATPALLPVTDGSVTITGSPSVSTDFFVIIGTTDGRVCARGLDGTVPGDDDDPENPWLSGCIALGDGLPVLSSSPAIGSNGKIHVTTASGLYVVE